MRLAATYPTAIHERAAARLVEFFRAYADVDAVLLVGSCARGRGLQDIDFVALIPPETPAARRQELWADWEAYDASEPANQAVRGLGDFGRVDLDIIDGAFQPDQRGWTSGPSEFELEVGNYVAYSVPLYDPDGRYGRLREEWLPYYDEALASKRLAETRKFCLNNLHHVHTFAERGVFFQAFHRLYDAFREFIQALFIARRTYPIAYDKWIREQIVEVLGLPNLYEALLGILTLDEIESDTVSRNARALKRLLEKHTA